MPLALILPRGDQWYLLQKPLIKRDKGDTLSLLVQILLEPWAPCAPPLLPCCSPGYPSWQLLNQPFLFYIVFAFHPCLHRFPHGVYKSCAVSCASSPLLRPPRSYPRSRSHLHCCSRFRPRSCPRSHPVFIQGSLLPSPSSPRPHLRYYSSFCPRSRPPILCSSKGLHPRPRPRSHPALFRSPTPPSP